MRVAAAALACAAVFTAAACARGDAAPPPTRHAVTDGAYAMGTVLEVTVVAQDEERARALVGRCLALARELEALFTTFRPESELVRLSAAAGRGPQAVDARLARILADAVGLSRLTQGAFDVSVGPLVELWSEAARRGRLPDEDEVAAARARVGSEKIRVERERVVLASPGMRLDLGGLAKGWALDRMRELLAAEGVRDALLDFGRSSIVAMGRPLDDERWTLALRGPEQGIAGVIGLRDQSLSVSGSLGQWSEIEGRRYGHVIDPRTGQALLRNALAAVVAPSGAEAEAWTKALLVLGWQGLALADAAPGVEAWLALEPGGERATESWAEVVRFEPSAPAPHQGILPAE